MPVALQLLVPAQGLQPAPGPARDLLRRELSGSEYRPTLLEQARDYLLDLLDRAQRAVAEAGAFNLLTLAILAVALAVALLWLLARLRPETRARTSPPVLGETRRSAADHRERARAALEGGRWDEVVVESLRSLARDLEQRLGRAGSLGGGGADVRPGSTAREVTGIAQRWYPDVEGLDAVARSFEDVVYGDRRATRADAEKALAAVEAVAAAEPRAAGGGRAVAAPR